MNGLSRYEKPSIMSISSNNDKASQSPFVTLENCMWMASRNVIEPKRFSSENVGITKINYRREMFLSLKNHLLVLFISWVVCFKIYILELDIEK